MGKCGNINLLVYGGRPPKNLVEKLHSRKDKYQVCEIDGKRIILYNECNGRTR